MNSVLLLSDLIPWLCQSGLPGLWHVCMANRRALLLFRPFVVGKCLSDAAKWFKGNATKGNAKGNCLKGTPGDLFGYSAILQRVLRGIGKVWWFRLHLALPKMRLPSWFNLFNYRNSVAITGVRPLGGHTIAERRIVLLAVTQGVAQRGHPHTLKKTFESVTHWF